MPSVVVSARQPAPCDMATCHMVHKPLFKAPYTCVDGTSTGNPLAQARIQNLKTHKIMTTHTIEFSLRPVVIQVKTEDGSTEVAEDKVISYLQANLDLLRDHGDLADFRILHDEEAKDLENAGGIIIKEFTNK